MQGRTYYILLARVEGESRYFRWHSDADSSRPDGVSLEPDGTVLTFATETAARANATERGWALSETPPHFYDVDRVLAWCNAPSEATLDCEALLDAWNLFTDLGPQASEATNLFGRLESQANQLYDKLFFGNNLPAVTPEGESYTPVWEAAELAGLSGLLRRGCAEFTVRLRSAGHLTRR